VALFVGLVLALGMQTSESAAQPVAIEILRQTPAIALVILYIVALARGWVRSPQEVEALRQSRDALRGYVDTVGPALSELSVALRAHILSQERTQAEQGQLLREITQRLSQKSE